MNTRERIIFTTKELCNQKKASNVTTNHIAAEAGIRSGNLYYYFKNKEEIIRELSYELFTKADRVWYELRLIASEEMLVTFFYKLSSLFWEYRFFYTELNLLLTNDPELRQAYVDRSELTIRFIYDTFPLYIEAGVMRDIPVDEERYALSRNVWLLAQSWINYYDILGSSITSEVVTQGVAQCYSILGPYIKASSHRKIIRLMKKMSEVNLEYLNLP